jgi:glucosamine-6-phosphate isomerase
LEQIIYETYQQLSVATAQLICAIVKEKPDALLCFPAGETSLGTFEELINLTKLGNISFKKCKIVGLDEWLNVGKRQDENCYSFLKTHFFDHIDYSEENICFFNGESVNPQFECLKTDDFIRANGPIDVVLLGLGMNGHLGLNEPGTPFNLHSHLVDLDETTLKVGQKYFSNQTTLSKGITLGLKTIMEAKTVLLQVNGSRKGAIVKQLLDSEITPSLPASIVKSHLNSFLLLDRQASGEL